MAKLRYTEKYKECNYYGEAKVYTNQLKASSEAERACKAYLYKV